MIDQGGTRREFFRRTVGRLAREAAVRTERRVITERHHRPPGALPELEFLAACTRCGKCTEVCPPGAIRPLPPRAGLGAGTPAIDAAIQPCTVCEDIPCAAACPTGALLLPADGWARISMGRLELVPERCIAFHGVACGVCARACPVGEEALALDAEGRPILKAEGCVGCGVCVRACVTAPRSLELQFTE